MLEQLRNRLRIYIHFGIMLVLSALIWALTGSTGAFILLVGAEIISLRIHQAEHHKGELFDNAFALTIGVAALLIGLLFDARAASIGELIFRVLTVMSVQGVSLGWHQHTHPQLEDRGAFTLITLSAVATLLCTLALTILARHL